MSDRALARMDTRTEATEFVPPPLPRVQVQTQSIDLFTLCKALAASGYFQDARQEAQAVVKVLYGAELGIPPVQAMMGIHVISGKPSPSAGLIATVIKRSRKYDYRVRRWDNQACELEFYERRAGGWELLGLSPYTMQDANTAGLAKGPNSKNWTAHPRNMLFARALTNGARIYCADVFGGAIYMPEEMGVPVDGETGEPVGLLMPEVETNLGERLSERVTAAAQDPVADAFADAFIGPDPGATAPGDGTVTTLRDEPAVERQPAVETQPATETRPARTNGGPHPGKDEDPERFEARKRFYAFGDEHCGFEFKTLYRAVCAVMGGWSEVPASIGHFNAANFNWAYEKLRSHADGGCPGGHACTLLAPARALLSPSAPEPAPPPTPAPPPPQSQPAVAPAAAAANTRPIPANTANGTANTGSGCTGCGRALTAGQKTVSTKRFGKALCPVCQEKAGTP